MVGTEVKQAKSSCRKDVPTVGSRTALENLGFPLVNDLKTVWHSRLPVDELEQFTYGGYCAEMLLKAAYFSCLGLPELSLLSWASDILPAIDKAKKTFKIAWPKAGQGHNVRAWSELLIAERAMTVNAYSPSFGLEVQRQGQRIGQLWSESLRYHKNVAYLHEVRQAREGTEWFLINSDAL